MNRDKDLGPLIVAFGLMLGIAIIYLVCKFDNSLTL